MILLSRNASAYNEADSTIVRHSKVLTQTLLKFIKLEKERGRGGEREGDF